MSFTSGRTFSLIERFRQAAFQRATISVSVESKRMLVPIEKHAFCDRELSNILVQSSD
jgi:hypothetical protein